MFNGSGKPIDRGPPVLAEDFLDIQGVLFCLLSYKFNFFCNICSVVWHVSHSINDKFLFLDYHEMARYLLKSIKHFYAPS